MESAHVRKLLLHVALVRVNMVGAKRTLSQEFSALKDIQSPTKSAKIHGVVTELTQMDSQSILKGEVLMKIPQCALLGSKSVKETS